MYTFTYNTTLSIINQYILDNKKNKSPRSGLGCTMDIITDLAAMVPWDVSISHNQKVPAFSSIFFLTPIGIRGSVLANPRNPSHKIWNLNTGNLKYCWEQIYKYIHYLSRNERVSKTIHQSFYGHKVKINLYRGDLGGEGIPNFQMYFLMEWSTDPMNPSEIVSE